MCMKGVFVVWVCIILKRGLEEFFYDWYEVIVIIVLYCNVILGVIMKNKVVVYFIYDFELVNFFDMKVKVILMVYFYVFN